MQGGLYLQDHTGQAIEASALGLGIVVCGISLLVGFLTPLVAVMIAFATIGIALSWLPPPATNLFIPALSGVLVVTVCTSLAFLGPGALSVDSRLFGRREIIIPEVPRSLRS
jgi:uncharacterized membrane protein YphA (DoxX/SURF4 family)